LDMFGTTGTSTLMSIANSEDFANDNSALPMSAWDFYEQHLNTWRRLLGEDFTDLIESKALKKMEFLRCEHCVLTRVNRLRVGDP